MLPKVSTLLASGCSLATAVSNAERSAYADFAQSGLRSIKDISARENRAGLERPRLSVSAEVWILRSLASLAMQRPLPKFNLPLVGISNLDLKNHLHVV